MFVACLLAGMGWARLEAKELTVFFTGETHAMLYQCNCPLEPDGGIARRATLLKQLRQKYPQALLVDAGASFAGGAFDEHSVNADLDETRTRVQLTAMRLMGYDAANVTEEEFSFGTEFFSARAREADFTFVSCNIKGLSEAVKPFVIKEVAGVKVALIGVTALSAMRRAPELTFFEPVRSVRETVEAARAEGAQLVIVLSQLDEGADEALVDEVKGIEVLISSHGALPEGKPALKRGNSFIAKASWQGRRLGVMHLQLDAQERIQECTVEEVRLSDAVLPDPDIQQILPQCFSDADCRKKGFRGACSGSGTPQAACSFVKPAAVDLTVVLPKAARTGDPQQIVQMLQSLFPGLKVTTVAYPGARSEQLLRSVGMNTLPAFLLSSSAETEPVFEKIKAQFDRKGAWYVLKPEYGGVTFFTARPLRTGALDLFVSLFDAVTPRVLESIQEYRPSVHFLATETKDGFDTKQGLRETEEYLRAVCVQKHFPDAFWRYLICRSASIESTWWEECLPPGAPAAVRACARSPEGAALLKESIFLNREIGVLFGPAYLIDNREIFTTRGDPNPAEFKRLFGPQKKR